MSRTNHLVELYTSVKQRVSKPNVDLLTVRDIVENLHLGTVEPEGVTYAETSAGGVPGIWCIPEGCDRSRALLYCHSGGTVVASMHTERKAAGHLAKAVGTRALVIDYRRSPENKYPAQIEDVEAAYRWLLAEGVESRNIATVGCSVGGNLALGLSLKLRDAKTPPPGAALLITPWLDLEMKNQTLETNAQRDALLSREILELFRESWIGGLGISYTDPCINLLHADLTGLCPLMVYYGKYDLLAGEAVDFAARAKASGVDVTLHALDEGQHNFVLAAGRAAEVVEPIKIMARWLRSQLQLE
jgi:monoterpene epsilon-lactone hydrolase